MNKTITREEIINMLAQRIVNSEKITTMQGAVEYVLQWADEHPKNPWRDAKKDPPKVGQKVIGMLDTGEIFDMKMTDDNIWTIDILTVDCPRFWMPMPEIPKGCEK